MFNIFYFIEALGLLGINNIDFFFQLFVRDVDSFSKAKKIYSY